MFSILNQNDSYAKEELKIQRTDLPSCIRDIYYLTRNKPNEYAYFKKEFWIGIKFKSLPSVEGQHSRV